MVLKYPTAEGAQVDLMAPYYVEPTNELLAYRAGAKTIGPLLTDVHHVEPHQNFPRGLLNFPNRRSQSGSSTHSFGPTHLSSPTVYSSVERLGGNITT